MQISRQEANVILLMRSVNDGDVPEAHRIARALKDPKKVLWTIDNMDAIVRHEHDLDY